MSSNHAEEPLLIFDDITEEAHFSVKPVGSASETLGQTIGTMSEMEIQSPMSAKSEEPASTFSPVESSKSSVSSVTDDRPKQDDSLAATNVEAAKPTEVERMSSLTNGLATVPASPRVKISQDNPKPRLPPGVTLEQLELAKSFMGGVAKKFVESPSPQNSAPKKDITRPRQEPTRMDWATEVNEAVAQHLLPSRPRSVLSSAPSTSETRVRTGLSSSEKLRRIELFTKTFGRPPNGITDYYQPNNAEFNPSWLRASADATSSTKGVQGAPTAPATLHARSSSSLSQGKPLQSPSPQKPVPFFKINIGSIYVATERIDVENNSVNLGIDVHDRVRILKYVSGNMWRGENLRTKKIGHVQKRFLREEKDKASRTVLPTKAASIHNLVDDIEETNAASWESDTEIAGSVDRPQPYSKAGEKSRHEEPQKASTSISAGITEQMRVEVNKFLDEKVSPSIFDNALTSSATQYHYAIYHTPSSHTLCMNLELPVLCSMHRVLDEEQR